MRTWRGRIAAVCGIAVAVPVVAVLVATLSFGRGDTICQGVTVSGIHVGGMRRVAADEVVRAWAKDRVGRTLTLMALSRRWKASFADVGASIRWKQAVDKAFDVGREGNIVRRAVCVLTRGGAGKQITASIAFDPVRLKKSLRKIGRAVDSPHRDARLKVVGDQLTVVQDGWGVTLDKERASRAIFESLSQGGGVVELPVHPDKPDVTANDASSISALLARYVTAFNPGKVGRTQNLGLAVKSISGTILKPGMEFSYNRIVGPRLEDRGYKEAQVFVRGKLEPGLGGGVCQVSSTIYNAVLLSDLKITERHHHSRTVPYVVPGRDATVAYGQRDLRFVNSNSSPIGIVAKLSGGRLMVDIYGTAADRKQVKISTSEAKRIAAGMVTYWDRNLRPGRRFVVDKGSRGVSVTVYKKVIATDGSSVTSVVSKDRYPPQKAVVAVGPRGVAAAPTGMRRVEAVHHPKQGVRPRLD